MCDHRLPKRVQRALMGKDSDFQFGLSLLPILEKDDLKAVCIELNADQQEWVFRIKRKRIVREKNTDSLVFTSRPP
jgi:hypothetical protein